MFCDFKRVSPKVRTIISCQTFLGKKAERERERERQRERERKRERERERERELIRRCNNFQVLLECFSVSRLSLL